jgi:hypothetical protein
MRDLSYVPSFNPEKGYVFLQLKAPTQNYEDYRQKRQALLEIACGAARIKFPQLKMAIGIAVEPPRFSPTVSEDFLLFDCREWSPEKEEAYETPSNRFGS